MPGEATSAAAAALEAFFRRRRMDGERMDASFELALERLVDHAMAFEPALSAEGVRHNIEAEVGFAAGAMSGMALVPIGFVFDAKALRRESRHELGRDDVLHSHRALPCARPSRSPKQCRANNQHEALRSMDAK